MSKEEYTKMDTQGMGAPMSPEDLAKWKASPEYKETKHKPAIVVPRRIHTPEIARELKILINEVLDEREYKRRLRMSYDDVKEPGVSYFETEHFKHRINEPEPPYHDWSHD